MTVLRWFALLLLVALPTIAFPSPAAAEPSASRETMPPMADHAVFAHMLFDRLEAHAGGPGIDFRWHGEGWIGTDTNKLWLRTEGIASNSGATNDGRHELLYGRAVSTWLDLRAGVRTDLDSATGRTWGAFGVRGLAPMFVEYEATAYFSDRGHAAARVALAYDLPITRRLILRPEIEANLYSKADPGRMVGSGLGDIDAGLRLRYEISRKFAPYIGVSYAGRVGETARMARRAGEPPDMLRFAFGIRCWI